MSEVMADTLIVRSFVPAEIVERFDRVSEAAMRYAAAEDALESVAAVEDAMDDRPLAEVLELHGYSRGVPAA